MLPGFRTATGHVDYGPFRQPYMMTFTEDTGGVLRNLTLFAVHPSPQGNFPWDFRDYLLYLQDVVAPLGAAETRIIGGDFNLRLMNPLTGAPAANTYQPLSAPPNYNYQPLCAALPGGANPLADLEAYTGYYATHIRESGGVTQDSRFIWSSPTGQSPYPGYGYIGSNFAPNFESVDNILVWPMAGGAYATTIMNPISGAPFNQIAAPAPGGAPRGGPLPGAALPSMMRRPNGWAFPMGAPGPTPPSPNAPLTNRGQRKNLTAWDNYGYIKSTSDHFAVVANI